MKARIIVDVEYHGATRALARIVSLIEWCRGEYAVERITITVEEDK